MSKSILLIIVAISSLAAAAREVDENYYNMHLDSDGDGWSNWSEYLAGTPRADSSGAPAVPIRFVVDYNGYLAPNAPQLLAGGRILQLEFYDSPAMDGFPNFSLTTNTVDFTLDRPFDGPMYVWMTAQASALYDPETDPAALVRDDRGWVASVDGRDHIRATLTDNRQMRGYNRLLLPAVAATDAPETLDYTVISMQGRVENFHLNINVPRNYLHEGDYLRAGIHGLGGNGSQEAFWFELYRNYLLYGMIYQEGVGIVADIITNQVAAAPVVVTGYDTTFAYARNELAWTMDQYSTWYTLSIATNAAGTSPLVTMSRTIIPFESAGHYRAALPFYVYDTRPTGATWANNTRYWVQVQTGMESGSAVSSAWHPIRMAISTNTSKSISGTVNYAGTNYFSSVTSTNLLPVVVQFFDDPMYFGVPEAQIRIAASEWSTNATTPTAGYSVHGLRPGKDYYGRAWVDLDADGIMDPFESRAVGYDLTQARPIPIKAPSHEPATTNYVMNIIDTDIDNDGLPDIWEWYKSGSITNGPLELGAY